jgi:hypothetical protein
MSITFRTEFTYDTVTDRWTDHGGPELNVSNTNAALLLERLGLDPADCEGGDIDADDLLGRAMVGNIGRDDSGVTAAEIRAPGQLTMIDCGVRPGYFDDRLSVLVEVATYAKTKEVRVQWC